MPTTQSNINFQTLNPYLYLIFLLKLLYFTIPCSYTTPWFWGLKQDNYTVGLLAGQMLLILIPGVLGHTVLGFSKSGSRYTGES